MALTLKIVIPGRVGGKGRGRAVAREGKDGRVFASVYTPKKTANAEASIKQFAFDAMRGRQLFMGPIQLDVAIFHLPTPSWSKRRKREAFYMTGKPDTDNVVKLIGDALNKIVWDDDAQVSDLHVIRRYIREGQERCEITVTALGIDDVS
jgi:Holliday junction resolvase RusA-like endonuclease